MNGPEPAYQHHWPEVPRALKKSRREISDLYRLPAVVDQLRAQHGCVRLIPLLGVRKVFDLDGEFAALVAGVEQSVKNRVAVKARHTAPDHAAAFINQRALALGSVWTAMRCTAKTAMRAMPGIIRW